MKSALSEYKGMLDSIIESDDSSIKEYYAVANKEMDSATDSRKQFYDFVKQVQADCSKLLDNPNLSPELVKMTNEKDSEIREQEKEIEEKVSKKDTEKREFNWKLVGRISMALVTVAGISAGVLGGKFDFKLQKSK